MVVRNIAYWSWASVSFDDQATVNVVCLSLVEMLQVGLGGPPVVGLGC